jgi:hypothetical protein
MRYITALLILLSCHTSYAQDTAYRYSAADTLPAKPVQFKRGIAYRLDTLTLLVNLDAFKEAWQPLWKTYYNLAGGGRESTNPSYNYFRWVLIDSIQRVLRDTIHPKDTVFLSHKTFARLLLRDPDVFAGLMDSGQCILFNHSKQQPFILRKNWRVDLKPGFAAGRAYFLPGSNTPFFLTRDAIT